MKTTMQAEVLFLNPDDLPGAIAKLTELGFFCERTAFVDPAGPTQWISAAIETELDEDDFFDWMMNLVGSVERGVDVTEAGIPPLSHLPLPGKCAGATADNVQPRYRN